MPTEIIRNPVIPRGASSREIARWMNQILVRGNMDWVPHIAGYADLLGAYPGDPGVTELDIQFSDSEPYAYEPTIMSLLYTPRVYSRVIALYTLGIELTGAVDVYGLCQCSPDPLDSSPTGASDYLGISATGDIGALLLEDGGAGGTNRVQIFGINCFDLAPKRQYAIRLGLRKTGTGDAVAQKGGNTLLLIHTPYIPVAGQKKGPQSIGDLG